MDPSTFLHVNIQIVPAPSVGRLSLFHYTVFHFCKKSGVHVFVGLFLDFFVPLSYLYKISQFWLVSVQFSHSVVSNSLWPHRLQHARLLCPSPTPGACSNSHPSSWLFHPTISSPVVLFSSCLHSFPASGSFPMSQFFTSGGQSIGVSASALVLSKNIQDWFPLGLTGLISLKSQESSPTPQFKNINSLALSLLYGQSCT